MLLRLAVFAVCLGSLQSLPAHAQESQRRFKILQTEEMTQAQKDLVKSIALRDDFSFLTPQVVPLRASTPPHQLSCNTTPDDHDKP